MPVSINTHGGSCCGARHIYSFDSIIQSGGSVDQIDTALRQVPFGRRVEAILNGRQVTSERGREVLERLARLGFVLTEHYMNHNHNPARDNFVFVRCDTRRPLTDLPFTWNGQVISAGLTGNLPTLPAATPVVVDERTFGPVDTTQPMEFEDGTPCTFARMYGVNGFVVNQIRRPNPVGGRRAPGPSNWFNIDTGGFGGNENAYLRVRNVRTNFAVGDTVQVTNANAINFNRSGTIVRFHEDGRAYVSIPNTYGARIYSLASLRKITGLTDAAPVVEPPVVEPPVVEMRHTQGDVAERVVERERVVAPPVRIVHTTWHNVYRDGRVGAGYDSLLGCETAAPRCGSRIRREVSSDGSVNDVRL